MARDAVGRALRAAARGRRRRSASAASRSPRVVSLETGKSRTESIAEVAGGGRPDRDVLRPMEEHGGYVSTTSGSFVARGAQHRSVLRPYGVFGVIAPFNFPVALADGLSPAALAAGNTVVLKPSEEAPRLGRRARRAYLDAVRLPEGVFNLVHGGAETGAALAGRAAPSNGSPSPARRRSAARSAQLAAARTRGRCSPRWAARTRPSSPRRPTSTRRPKASPARPSASRARSAAPARARSWDRTIKERLSQRLAECTEALPLGDPRRTATLRRPGHQRGGLRALRRPRSLRRAATAPSPRAARLPGERSGWFVEPTVVDDSRAATALAARRALPALPTVTSRSDRSTRRSQSPTALRTG